MATLSRRKLLILIVVGIAAIGAMITAPDGSVSEMFARMSGRAEGIGNLKITPPTPFPQITFLDASGVKQSISAYRGKVVAVNFWALWCAPCKIEKPKLDRLQGDLGTKGLTVLSLSDASDDPDIVQEYFTFHKIQHLKPAQDPQSNAFRTLQLRGLPTTIILNKQGQEIARAEGPMDWDAPEIRAFLEGLLQE